MKKLFPVLIALVLLAGCSGLPTGLPNIPGFRATPAAIPVDTNTPEPTVTLVPTQEDLFAIATNTPVTFTPTETPLVPDAPPTETPTRRPTFSPPSDNANIFTPQSVGFLTVLISGYTLYWNEGPCMPRNIKINAIVVDPASTDKVLLFMRLREKKNTLNITKWGGGAIMLQEDNGSYSYNIRPFNISRYYYYKDAWLEYQLVAVTKDMEVVGRTQIYDRNISLVRCMPVK